jgi:predicted metal-dependent RNase
MRIHRHNVIYCRKELQRKILMSDSDPFKSSNFFPVETRQDRSKAASEGGASIIVTTSGMLKGGPVVYYLQRLAGNPSNKIIVVGYQADGTPGRALLEGAKTLKFEHATVNIRLEVRSYHLSGHADRPHLEAMIRSIRMLKNVFIIHGEKSKIEELSGDIQKNFRVIVPELGKEYDV